MVLAVHACGGTEASPQAAKTAAKAGRDAKAAQPAEPSCDVRMLFAADGLTGVGCSGAICHTPGVMSLDLQSDGLEQRLLNEPANPKGPCAGEKLVDGDKPDNSLLLKKISGKMTCGSPMPLTMPGALSEDQTRCIQEYVDLVAAGGKL
jgi:hypothetical protein